MIAIGPISSVFDYVTFAILIWGFGALHQDEKFFQTGWFIESIVSQTLIVHVIRTGKVPFLQSMPSWPLLFTTIAVCAVGMYLPFSRIAHGLSMVPVPLLFLAVMPIIMVAYVILTQWSKSLLIKRFGLN
jgi:Mg2+-importing ATPase